MERLEQLAPRCWLESEQCWAFYRGDVTVYVYPCFVYLHWQRGAEHQHLDLVWDRGEYGAYQDGGADAEYVSQAEALARAEERLSAASKK